jgi:hypothetical protein
MSFAETYIVSIYRVFAETYTVSIWLIIWAYCYFNMITRNEKAGLINNINKVSEGMPDGKRYVMIWKA